MIKSIKAENYKSIKSLELELGRVNVFIGENGAGKSNILEVFALAGAAVARKLDNEFLSSRGIRVAEPEFMRSAFSESQLVQSISIDLEVDMRGNFSILLNNNNEPYSVWTADVNESWTSVVGDGDGFFDDFFKVVSDYFKYLKTVPASEHDFKELTDIFESLKSALDVGKAELKFDEDSSFKKFFSEKHKSQEIFRKIESYLIFSPENSSLKTFQREGQIEPLGINGEGLLKLLSVLSKQEPETLQEIKSSLQVLGWFEDFKLVDGDTFSPSHIAIKDRYIEDTKRYFDQMSANEGFLFLLFYFALFSTKLTPSIFAIDNIDASLNPALCEKLVRELVKLAKKHDKQVLLTTHNPATLDGLDLNDDEQRLFVVSRGHAGETRVRRIQMKPQTPGKERPIRLSEMFLRGSLGGIPAGF